MKIFRKNKEKFDQEAVKSIDTSAPQKHSFFDRISFFRMTKQAKTEIAEEILSDTYISKIYWLQLSLSSLIATLWLLTNSTPVVIGAMLIAPILQPIKAFSFAVTTGNKLIYIKAIKHLLVSILVAVATAFVVSWAVPFADLTAEVMARTSPTIVDLFIALSSGVIAVLSLGFKKLSEGIAGVAMSVALMPPLCVMWVGLQFFNREVMTGSSLLFLTNLIAIIVVGIIVFYAFGFFPTNKVWQKRSAAMSFFVVLTIGVLIFPLWKGMESIAQNFSTQSVVHDTFDSFRDSVNHSIHVQDITIQSPDDDLFRIQATLNIPDTLQITNEHKQELTERLAVATQHSIELQLSLIGVSSVHIADTQETDTDIQFQTQAKRILSDYPELILIDIKIASNSTPLVLLELYNETEDLPYSLLEARLESAVQEFFGADAKLLLHWQTEPQIAALDDHLNFFEESIKKQFSIIFPDENLVSLNVSDPTDENLVVDMTVESSLPEDTLSHYLTQRKNIMQKYFQKTISLHVQVNVVQSFSL